MGPAWGQPAREHAHSLARSLHNSHTSETSLFACVLFWKRRCRVDFLGWRRSPNNCEIFSNMSLPSLVIDAYLKALASVTQGNVTGWIQNIHLGVVVLKDGTRERELLFCYTDIPHACIVYFKSLFTSNQHWSVATKFNIGDTCCFSMPHMCFGILNFNHKVEETSNDG